MRKYKKCIAHLTLVLGVFCSFFFPVKSVFAADQTSIVSKGALEGVHTCLGGGAFAASWQASNLSKGFLLNNGTDDAVKFPYGWTNASHNNANCKEIMFGGDNVSGMIPYSVTSSKDTKTIAQFFAGDNFNGNGGIGYTAAAIGSETEGSSQKLKLKLTSTEKQCNDNVPTMSVDGNVVSEIVFPTIAKSASGKTITIGSDSYNVPAPGSKGKMTILTNCSSEMIILKDAGSSSSPKYVLRSATNFTSTGDETWNVTIGTKISGGKAVYTNTKDFKITLYGGATAVFSPTTEPGQSNEKFANDYKMQWDKNRATDLLTGLNSKNIANYKVTGLTNYDGLKLTRQEVYDLYKYYAKDVFKASIICEGETNYELYASQTPINWKAGAQCRLYNRSSAKSPKYVYGVDSNYHFTAEISLDDLIATLSSLGDLSDLNGSNEGGIVGDETVPTPTPTPTPGSSGSEAGDVDNMSCDSMQISDGKIGAMQWILCPAMDNTRYTASWIDEKVQSWLDTSSSFYDNDSVKTVWEYIRNIANVLMIVFLSVVIFSQLTGYGIDNYGIKKMLPRLIVMAIVVNLSLYICQIAADLSNILGIGLRNMFASVGGAASGLSGTDYLGGAMVGTFSAAAGAGGTAVAAGFAAFSIIGSVAIALIVVFIVLFLIVLVALFVFTLMLGARQIIMILCIVLAPLAFAAFILPNTQNIFKKWWDLFKAALIIFPICGAVSGISYLLRGMANNPDVDFGVGGKILMVVLPYLVFFLLPTLLKEAISALGKVGGALTSMGQSIRNGGRQLGQGVSRAAQNSEWYKNRQAEVARTRQSDSSQRTIDRLEALKKRREARGGQLNERETRQLARAHEIQKTLSGEDTKARTALVERDYAGRSMEDLVNDWDIAFDAGDVDKMNALTNVIVSRHGPGGVNSIASRIAEKNIFIQNPDGVNAEHPDGMTFRNDAMKNSFNALQANMMQNSSLAGAMQSKASDIYQMVSGSGYVDGKRQNAMAHAANNGIATQTKDWATQSSATLKRAIDAGQLTADDAKALLNSTDPAIQSGLQSDKGKREVLQAAAAGYKSGHNGAWEKDVVKGADGKDVQMAAIHAENYRHSQAAAEQADLDVRAEDRRRIEDMARNIEEMNNRQKGGNDNNAGQGFDQGAGI